MKTAGQPMSITVNHSLSGKLLFTKSLDAVLMKEARERSKERASRRIDRQINGEEYGDAEANVEHRATNFFNGCMAEIAFREVTKLPLSWNKPNFPNMHVKATTTDLLILEPWENKNLIYVSCFVESAYATDDFRNIWIVGWLHGKDIFLNSNYGSCFGPKSNKGFRVCRESLRCCTTLPNGVGDLFAQYAEAV